MGFYGWYNMNKQIEDIDGYNAKDLEFMIAATVALWGDGTVSKEESNFFLEQLKSLDIENDLFDIGYADREDLELMAKEYILWLFETIQLLKEKLLESKSEADSRKQTLAELLDLYRKKPNSSEVALLRFIKSMESFGCRFDSKEKAMLEEIEENYRAVGNGCLVMLMFPIGIITLVYPEWIRWIRPDDYSDEVGRYTGLMLIVFPIIYLIYKGIVRSR